VSAYDYDHDWDEPDGSCESCGIDLGNDPDGDHDSHHRLCWACWRGEDPDDDEGDER
jgi:hypothetical protein